MLIPAGYRNERVISSVEKLWRNAYPRWSWKTPNPYQAEYSWAFDRLFESMTGKKKTKTVVDAGGGRGAFQHVLAATGLDVLNVDAEASQHASKLATPTRQLRAQLDATGLEPGSLDGIVSVSAIEHNDWATILRIVHHLVDLLKPRAPLVMTFPAAGVRRWIPKGAWPLRQQAAWPQCYLFDEEAAREVAHHVSDSARLVEPRSWLGREYTACWKAQHRADYPYPYLSAGIVLRRRDK